MELTKVYPRIRIKSGVVEVSNHYCSARLAIDLFVYSNLSDGVRVSLLPESESAEITVECLDEEGNVIDTETMTVSGREPHERFG